MKIMWEGRTPALKSALPLIFLAYLQSNYRFVSYFAFSSPLLLQSAVFFGASIISYI
jgi:hypothetical protein